MQEKLYLTADAGDPLTDSGCRSLYIRQWVQETLYQTTVDAGVSLSDRRCRGLYQTADAGDTQSDIGCKRQSIRQQMQETLYQPADVGISLSDSG